MRYRPRYRQAATWLLAVFVSPMQPATDSLSHIAVAMCGCPGECGLDFNRNFSPPDVQEQWFAEQVGGQLFAQVHYYWAECWWLEPEGSMCVTPASKSVLLRW